MKYYFAPMEGITLYPLRNIHHEIFGDGIDKYYTPFLSAHHNLRFKKREKRDVMPEFIDGFENYGDVIIPQIMANRVDTFVWATREMWGLGYNEVNYNLGCPAATVTNRHKGSGLLQDTEYLDEMLDGIFNDQLANTIAEIDRDLYYLFVMNKPLVLSFMYLIIFIIISFLVIRHSNNKMIEIISATDQILKEPEKSIELSSDLVTLESRLNDIRVDLITNQNNAKEAVQRKNDLIMYMAHDLKTPLTSIIGYLTLLTGYMCSGL